MDFRQYDAAIGRFTGIDPITHHSMSTYTGFDNNPVYWADPSGSDSEKGTTGADGLTNEQWIALSRPNGGGWSAMRAQAKLNSQEVIQRDKGTKLVVGEGQFNVSGDLIEKPNKISLADSAGNILVNTLLWAIYVKQNRDKSILASDIVERTWRKPNNDIIDIFGGTDIMESSLITVAPYGGTAKLTYLNSLVFGNSFADSPEIDDVVWGKVLATDKLSSLMFKTKPIQSTNNFFTHSDQNRLNAIILRFTRPEPLNKKKAGYLDAYFASKLNPSNFNSLDLGNLQHLSFFR